jgi:hypothetical protein
MLTSLNHDFSWQAKNVIIRRIFEIIELQPSLSGVAVIFSGK